MCAAERACEALSWQLEWSTIPGQHTPNVRSVNSVPSETPGVDISRLMEDMGNVFVRMFLATEKRVAEIRARHSKTTCFDTLCALLGLNRPSGVPYSVDMWWSWCAAARHAP